MHAVQHDIKDIVFTGDFFHTHSSIRSEVLWAAHNFLSALKREGIKSTFIIGNHDYSDKEGDLHSIDFLKEFGDVVDKPGRYGDLFWAMSYTEDQKKLMKFLDESPVNSIVLMHQGLNGMPVNSKGFTINEILHPSMVPDHVAGAFVGHYHSRFQVHNKKIWSPGSPLQLTWTDSGEDRGLLDVIWHSDKPLEVVPINISSPRFVSLTEKDITLDNCEGNFIKIEISDNMDITNIKEKVMSYGARSCEMVRSSVERSGELSTANSGSFDSLSSIVGAYMDIKRLDMGTRKVGEQIMEGTYSYEGKDI